MGRKDTKDERAGAQQVRRRTITKIIPDKRHKERENQIKKDIRKEGF
tara:strand:- start:157 stop:297 length:141 start_codon:yes stop_codon:yes gene_type:complete